MLLGRVVAPSEGSTAPAGPGAASSRALPSQSNHNKCCYPTYGCFYKLGVNLLGVRLSPKHTQNRFQVQVINISAQVTRSVASYQLSSVDKLCSPRAKNKIGKEPNCGMHPGVPCPFGGTWMIS